MIPITLQQPVRKMDVHNPISISRHQKKNINTFTSSSSFMIFLILARGSSWLLYSFCFKRRKENKNICTLHIISMHLEAEHWNGGCVWWAAWRAGVDCKKASFLEDSIIIRKTSISDMLFRLSLLLDQCFPKWTIMWPPSPHSGHWKGKGGGGSGKKTGSSGGCWGKNKPAIRGSNTFLW